MTTRYWQSSRPDFKWLQQFQINPSAQITFLGTDQEQLSPIQLEWVREWITAFIKSCSQILQNFSKMLDPKQMVFTGL